VLSRDGQYGFTTCEGTYGDLIFVLERMEARLFDSSGETPIATFNDPTVVGALARYTDAARQHPLTPATSSKKSGWPDSSVRGDHPDGVRSGQVAMWIDYVSSHAFAPPLPFEVGVAPLPAQSEAEESIGARATTEFSVYAYYISAHTAEPQACWEWLTFLSSRSDGVQLLPARLNAAASPKWQEEVGEEPLRAYLATLEYEDTAILRLRWEHAWLAYTYPWLDEAFQATVAGEDAGQALAEAQRKVTAYLDCVERVEGFEDREVMVDCARETDPGYPLSGE
jgi:ABC-type glycerol-3-phosphate transport system substrate-binding protein